MDSFNNADSLNSFIDTKRDNKKYAAAHNMREGLLGLVGMIRTRNSTWALATAEKMVSTLVQITTPQGHLSNELAQKHPRIESTLRTIYEDTNDVEKWLQLKKLERRRHERYEIDKLIQIQILGNNGRLLSNFQRKINDISQGGLSFFVRMTQKGRSRRGRLSCPQKLRL